MKRRRAGWWLAASAAGLCAAAGAIIWLTDRQEPVYEPAPGPLELSAWLPEWQREAGLTDALQLEPQLAGLYAFGIYFDESDRLLMRDAFATVWDELADYGDHREALHLTLVNDRILEGGASVQKDPELVGRLVATPESRARHIDEILQLAGRLGAVGVEVDYERIEEKAWDGMLRFIGELYAATESHGLAMRVVLEPRAPLERLSLPEGPQYVMMAYNLHGPHSGPGPKTDHAMIQRLTKRLKSVPGRPVLALATGGFDWGADGKTAALTEQQAAALARSTGSEPERDEASGALIFSYSGDSGDHTVWYADGETLTRWIGWSRQGGIDRIALWRLGGMQPETVHRLLLY
ncbi:hypothetical protein PA598K_03291 [Paenibacillus sp. 598K]|uniref:glycosyl hydrolase n=1 Tax=Paenibacillus sp. 598K TaxID=1117987 RepID=UPI000FFA3FA4|nr:glycosyl hydrolase [Paenibacillus sp. 598K]GBF74920.1 hypothetical protein PA598K_03291 [Paenibacillus sp. 598K]